MRFVAGVLVAFLVGIPRAGQAQTAPPTPENSRLFLEVNFLGSASSQAKTREFTSLFPLYGEVATTESLYPKPSLANPFSAVDVGGGIMLSRVLGVGVTVGRTAYEDVANLAATIPHPSILNAPTTASAVTNNVLRRRETATHVFLAIVPLRTARFEVRFFGGPSYFIYSADMVREVVHELSSQNALTISGFTSSEAEAGSLGMHLGGDFAWFLTRRFGIASGLRFSRSTVTLDREPLSTIAQDIRVGSTHIYVGGRFRFDW